jgi:hypothetical protein
MSNERVLIVEDDLSMVEAIVNFYLKDEWEAVSARILPIQLVERLCYNLNANDTN